MLKLKPTQRLNRRYLLLESGNEQEVKNVILEYIGVLGYAQAAPMFLKGKNNDLILAITRESLNNVRAAIEVSKTKIKIKRVSGTLKGLSI